MFFVTLVLGVLFLGIACLCYQVRPGMRRAWAFLGFGATIFVFGACVPSLLLFVQSALLAVLGLIANRADINFKSYARTAILTTSLVFLIPALLFVEKARQRERLRKEYPFEPLGARISYEVNHSGPAPGQRVWRTLPAESESRLSAMEQAIEHASRRFWRDRSEALRLIHTSHVQAFVDTPAFGVGRVIRMTQPEQHVGIDRRDPIPLPPAIDLSATPDRVSIAWAVRPGAAPTRRQLNAMFDASVVDFVNRRGWGFIKDRNHVAGFQEHAFRQAPILETDASVAKASSDFVNRFDDLMDDRELKRDPMWQLTKLELVSLLKHEEPSVYVTEKLPRMNDIADYPIRALNSFESGALRQLQAGEDLVTHSSANTVRMLGSLRAARQCLRCHQVERGDLLGAFSYVLDRTVPVLPQSDPKPLY